MDYSKNLRNHLNNIAIPRHFVYEKNNNIFVCDYISKHFIENGYTVEYLNSCSNILAYKGDINSGSKRVLGSHYDSVPGCPGADDNGSAVVAMLEASVDINDEDVVFVAFNREEDNLLGSREFCDNLFFDISEVHILEMVGFFSDEENSQKMFDLPLIKIPTVGNFLGLVSNKDSNSILNKVVDIASEFIPDLSVLGLKIYLGLENNISVLEEVKRSDHSPFWDKGIPALMWTDTANFRNDNYHKKQILLKH